MPLWASRRYSNVCDRQKNAKLNTGVAVRLAVAESLRTGERVASIKKIIVGNEKDAFLLLEQALNNELGDMPFEIDFKNWPILSIRLEGKGYDSTITPDVAEGIVSLQAAINRAYARTVHKATNARKLTEEQRSALQFKAKVKQGSSLIEINLGEPAKVLIQELVGKVTTTDLVIAGVGLAIVAGSYLTAKIFLHHRTEGKTIDAETERALAYTREETKRMQILATALSGRAELQHAMQDFDNVRRSFVKATGDADRIAVNGISLTQDDARTVAAATRTESINIQVNGSYQIQKIDWQHEDEARLWLESSDASRRFVATLRTVGLTEAQLDIIQEAEWARRKVYLSINANELRGEITTAAIVGIAWPEDVAI